MWGVFRFRFLWHTTKAGTPEHGTSAEQWNTGGTLTEYRNTGGIIGIPWKSGTTEQQNNTTRK